MYEITGVTIVPDGGAPRHTTGKKLVNWGSVWGSDKCKKLYGVETTQAGGVSGFE